MTELNAAIRAIPIPPNMRRLPISPKGFPVPWFVAFIDGAPDFRVIAPGKIGTAHRRKCCWLCGQPLGQYLAFTIGPMGAVNRISAEPPSHHACAQYAAAACPFLTKPNMRRNEADMPEEAQEAPGTMIKRNPGVVALWITRKYQLMRAGDGVLFKVGDPERVEWYAEGRPATRAEVEASIASGYPLLEREAAQEGTEAMAALSACLGRAQALLPAA